MRRVFSALVACLAVAACTPSVPPPQPTAAELALPHDVLVDDAKPRIRVDADTAIFVPGLVGYSVVGALIGLAVTGAVVAAQAPGAASRDAQRTQLENALGDSSEASRLFSASFRRTLRQSLSDIPTLQLSDVPVTTEPGAIRARPTLTIAQDVVLSADGRMLIGRASVIHALGNGPARHVEARRFLVFSAPIDAPAGAEAIAAWTANGGRRLREQAPVLGQELATLVRTIALSQEGVNFDQLPETRIQTPGAGLLLWQGGSNTDRLPERATVRVVRQADGRALVVARLGRAADVWTWISLPDSALESNRRV